MNVKRIASLIFAIAIVVCGCMLTPPEGLSREALIVLSLFGFVICTWIGEVCPKFVSTLIAMVLLYFLGVADSINEVWQAFISSVFFFLLAAFALATVVKKSTIPLRLMGLFIRVCQDRSSLIVLAIMLSSAIVSAFMSDLAACALAVSIVLPVIRGAKMPERFVRCLMIAIPIASLTGGFSTPIGSPSNITIMSLLGNFAMSVSFVQWAVVGVPLACMVLAVSWVVLVFVYRPEKLDQSCVEDINGRFDNLGHLSAYDVKAIVVLVVMMVAWVSSTWTPPLDSTLVAVCGLCIMFLPGVELLSWSDFNEGVPWDMVLMLNGLMAMAVFLNTTEALDWVVGSVMSDATSWSPLAFLYIVSVVICVLRSCVPSGPPVVVMLAPGLIALSYTIGLNPFCVVLAISIWTQITFLVPSIDALYLITYSTGCYTTTQLWKAGIPLTVFFLAALPPITYVMVNTFIPL
ncbi:MULTISPECIES: SLC13 family permease [unclassified Adlercreutzia]|uniref:SLC13 family permease n=1 Tax=unclassified Adlercreutzia TaxID=2636013 RepID=UPI0013E9A326|nr:MULTISPECIES: SLC13 family permease [unclassified Adlercreutzia]